MQWLEHGSQGRGAHPAGVGTVHLDDSETEGVHGGAAPRVAGAAPPDLAAGRAPVEAESMRAHLDRRLTALAQAVPELPGETGEREWKPEGRRCLLLVPCTCN